MSATTDAYFDRVWESDDPWDQEHRWSEHRKYGITIASLLRARYTHAFEPGCATGILTERLAERSARVTATDRHPHAVARTRERLAGRDGVDVVVGRLPEVPVGHFDLIVLSEVLYYLEAEDVRRTLDAVAERSTADAHLVAVHYRPEVADHALRGDAVHELLAAHPRWHVVVRHVDPDFLLDVCERR
jgi:SAM-dependent methyltransferase